MIELLALPAWNTPPRSLDDWSAALAGLGYPPKSAREDADEVWLEVPALRLRGLAVLEGPHVTAINFELHDPDPAASRLVEGAAAALGWEVHPDEEDEDVEED